MTPWKAFWLVWFLLMLTAKSAHCGVVVAVIDTGLGVALPHVVKGWSFVSNSADTSDTVGHGTHVSGIISGIAPEAEILPIKYYAESAPGQVNSNNLLKSFNYAVQHKVNIINFSGGGPSGRIDELEVLVRAEAANILVVVAAGNEHADVNSDAGGYYPCSYGLRNVICVANVASEGRLAPSSNYGMKVDVAAVGENVLSYLPGGRRGYKSGTSMAAAEVSGLAAKLLLEHPGASAKELKRLILESAHVSPELEGKVRTGRWIKPQQP